MDTGDPAPDRPRPGGPGPTATLLDGIGNPPGLPYASSVPGSPGTYATRPCRVEPHVPAGHVFRMRGHSMLRSDLRASRWMPAVVAGVLLPLAAGASNFSYTYVEGSYGSVSVDDSAGDFDGDVWGISGSWQFHDMAFAYGGYEMGDYDFDIDTDAFEVGLGLAFPVGQTVDFALGAGYVDVSVDLPGFGSDDDNGYSAFAGIRAGFGGAFQVDAGASYVDLSDSGSDTTYSIIGRYYFTEAWAVGAGYQTADDADAWLVTVRWEMPR